MTSNESFLLDALRRALRGAEETSLAIYMRLCEACESMGVPFDPDVPDVEDSVLGDTYLVVSGFSAGSPDTLFLSNFKGGFTRDVQEAKKFSAKEAVEWEDLGYVAVPMIKAISASLLVVPNTNRLSAGAHAMDSEVVE